MRVRAAKAGKEGESGTAMTPVDWTLALALCGSNIIYRFFLRILLLYCCMVVTPDSVAEKTHAGSPC